MQVVPVVPKYRTATRTIVNKFITRNKSNASFEALQYRQDLFAIAHYHNRKKLPKLYTLFRKSQ